MDSLSQSNFQLREEEKPSNHSAKSVKKTTMIIATDSKTGESIEISYSSWKPIGSGSFGVVYEANLTESNEKIAIKKVLQDKRFKNRELQIMRMIDHPNIVELKSFFYSNGEKKDEVFLNLVLEYLPETVYRFSKSYIKKKEFIPTVLIQLYMYQLFRALSYIHSLGICHRDIKPQNLLIDSTSGVLKLCDFGSAKVLIAGEQNVSYICSRYYRAPELIFGATNYTTQIDTWSAGCILSELILGKPIFPGESGVDQLVEIIKVLGTPNREQVKAMNPNYTEHTFPPIKAHPWNQLFGSKASSLSLELVQSLLCYNPKERLSAIEAMSHPFFIDLRSENRILPSGRPFPPLFNFTKTELSVRPDLLKAISLPNANAS